MRGWGEAGMEEEVGGEEGQRGAGLRPGLCPSPPASPELSTGSLPSNVIS